MEQRDPSTTRNPPRFRWALPVFLAVFTVGVALLAVYYIIPATRTFAEADARGDVAGKRAISATAALLMVVILLILLAGVFLTARLGRFFFPRQSPPRTRTTYVDAWSESARRMETPPADDEHSKGA